MPVVAPEEDAAVIMRKAMKTGFFDIAAERRGNRLNLFVFLLMFAFFAVTAYGRNIVWINGVALLSDAVVKSPLKARTHSTMGNAYAGMGRFDEAKKSFMIALRLRPDRTVLHGIYVNLGLLYLIEGRLDGAIKQYKILLRINPSNAGAYNNLGVIYERQGKPEPAMEMFQAALNLSPNNVHAIYNAGRMSLKKGARDEAQRAFEMALKINPDYGEARKELEALNSGSR